MAAERVRDLHHVGRARAAQARHRFSDLERVADRAAQRLIHRREQRAHLFAARLPHPHQRLRQQPRLRPGLHERPAAKFYVEHQRIDSLRQLLRQDRATDQGNAFHRRGHVAQRVQFLIRRRQVLRLSDQRTADLRHLGVVGGEREIRAKPRDRLQLVQRAPGMAQAAAANHRHRHTARDDHRRQRDRNLVADSTRGVLVDLHAGDVGQIRDHAGTHHRVGVVRGLLRVHAAKENRHQHRGELVVLPRAIGGAPDKRGDFLAGERVPVPLSRDHMLGKHAGTVSLDAIAGKPVCTLHARDPHLEAIVPDFMSATLRLPMRGIAPPR